MGERKIIKEIREFDDGDKEYIDGKDLKNFQYNLEISAVAINSHDAFGSYKPVKWKKMGGKMSEIKFRCEHLGEIFSVERIDFTKKEILVDNGDIFPFKDIKRIIAVI